MSSSTYQYCSDLGCPVKLVHSHSILSNNSNLLHFFFNLSRYVQPCLESFKCLVIKVDITKQCTLERLEKNWTRLDLFGKIG